MKAAQAADTSSTNDNGIPHGRAARRYHIRDRRGKVIAIKERVDGPRGKQLQWLQPDGTPGLNGTPIAELPLYGTARLAKLPNDSAVIVVEGEKATEALWRRNYSAVGSVTGANTIPCDESLYVLLGHPVFLWPDADEPGREHMLHIATRLHAIGHHNVRMVVWSDAPPKGDAADFSGTDDELQTLFDAAEPVSHSTETSFTLTRLSDVTPSAIRSLWPSRVFLAKLNLLDGDPGLGKSLLILDIAARVSQQRPMPDGTDSDLNEARGVVLLSAEDDPADTIRPRLEAAGADLSRIVLLSSVRESDGQSRPPHLGDLEVLRAAISAVNAALVIIDPFMAYLPDERDSYRDQDIRRVLAPLAALAHETGVAIIVVRHLNKTANGNPLYRGGGSIGIIAAARSSLLVAPDPDDPDGRVRVLAITKSNLAAPSPSLRYRVIEKRPGVPGLEWLGESPQTAATLLAATADTRETQPELNAAATWLRELLAHGAMPAQRVLTDARHAGLAEKTLRRAAKQIGLKITKESFNGGWMWALPTDVPTKMAIDPKMVNSEMAILGKNGSAMDTGKTGNTMHPTLQALMEKGQRKWVQRGRGVRNMDSTNNPFDG